MYIRRKVFSLIIDDLDYAQREFGVTDNVVKALKHEVRLAVSSPTRYVFESTGNTLKKTIKYPYLVVPYKIVAGHVVGNGIVMNSVLELKKVKNALEPVNKVINKVVPLEKLANKVPVHTMAKAGKMIDDAVLEKVPQLRKAGNAIIEKLK